MTDGAETTSFEAGSQPVAASASWAQPAETSSGPAEQHPELLVGAAFAGGLVVAMILKRLAG